VTIDTPITELIVPTTAAPPRRRALRRRSSSRGRRVLHESAGVGEVVRAPCAWLERRRHGDPLTHRERDVLRAAADGASTEDIAATPFLSPDTVRN
jgi:DNA-binding NarL/FixJ family response regulator